MASEHLSGLLLRLKTKDLLHRPTVSHIRPGYPFQFLLGLRYTGR